MTTTRIYQLDTIAQSDIKGNHVAPFEDSAGTDTTRITLGQLAQYFFNNASTTDDSGPMSGYPLVIGNNSNVDSNGVSVAVFGASNTVRMDDGGTPSYSSAIGYNNHVYGHWGSSAVGYRNNATVSQASAFGHKNTANARLASAFGTDNTASGDGSSAFGRNNTASSYGSIAAGYHNSASGEYSSAVGADNQVNSYNAQAFGCYNTISAYGTPGNWCTAIGSKNTVFSPPSFFSNSDYNGKSTACGYHNFVAGPYNTAVGANNSIETMGYVIKCSAIGYGNTASGYWGASAVGYRNNAQQIQTSAFGHKNTANASQASAFGSNNTASGEASVAYGIHNTSSNNYAATFGTYNTATGSASMAAGYACTSSGDNSLAIGWESASDGDNSSAIGRQSSSSGDNSLAIGYQCSSIGNNSSAIGYNAVSRPIATTNIGGAIVVRADNSEGYNSTDMFTSYAGVQNIVMTSALDMTKATFSIINVLQYSDGAGYQVGDTLTVTGGNGDAIITVASVDGGGAPTGYTITNPGTGYATGTNIATTIISSGDGNGYATVDIWVAEPIQINVPSGCLFYPDEIGLITTGTVSSVTAQPNVQFGWNGTPAGLLASTPTINLTQVGSREVFTSLLTCDGKSTLTFSVTGAASATTLACRAYFKGILIENTPIG